jgi:CheY-like chemotaxis protein/Tfp pilus assembly protein PilZ
MTDPARDNKTVLVADHRGPERQVLDSVLKRLGYSVLTVETAGELETALQGSTPVDLVILFSDLYRESADDMARSISRPDRRVILVESAERQGKEVVGFIDITENAIRGINVRVPEIVFLANDLLFARTGTPRRKRRIYGGFPARFEIAGETVEASIYNLSAEGAFIETLTPPESGVMLRVHFELSGPGAFALAGKVTWRVQSHETQGRRSPPGMGVHFVDVDPGDEEKIRAYVNSGGRPTIS